MTTHSGTVMATRATVLNSKVAYPGPDNQLICAPGPTEIEPHTTYPSGMKVAATRAVTVAVTSGPGRAALSGREVGAAGRETGGATTYSKPAAVIMSDTFCAFNAEGSTLGACSESSGGRAGFAGTPLATGYSNEVPFSSTS